MEDRNKQEYINFTHSSANQVQIAGDCLSVGDCQIDDFEPGELVQRRKAFNLEVVPHMKFLYNYALRITGNTLSADELFQETLLRAFSNYNKFEKDSSRRAWLFRIMKNCYINNYRQEKEEPVKVNYLDLEDQSVRMNHSVINPLDLEQRIFANVLDDDLVKALNSLINDYKTVVILCDLEGMCYEEIAECLNWSIKTVRRRLHRARRILQSKLIDYARTKGYCIDNAVLKSG